MVLRGITSYPHEAVPHYSRVSNSSPLPCAHTLLLLFLFHVFTTCLLLLVAPGPLSAPGHLRSDLKNPNLCRWHCGIMARGKTHLGHHIFPLPPGMHSTGLVIISG